MLWTSLGCPYGCSRVVPLGIVHYPIRILVSYPFLKWSYVKVFELIRGGPVCSGSVLGVCVGANFGSSCTVVRYRAVVQLGLL